MTKQCWGKIKDRAKEERCIVVDRKVKKRMRGKEEESGLFKREWRACDRGREAETGQAELCLN